jgi:phosphatidylglycerophosphate synthase
VTADAVIYVSSASDTAVVEQPVAGRPVVFRAVAAAVRAGITRVFVPAAFQHALTPALSSAPRVARAIVWLAAGAPPPASAVLIPATVVIGPSAVAALRAVSPPAEHEGALEVGVALVTAGAGDLSPFWTDVIAGAPVGDDVRKLAHHPAATSIWDGALVHRVTDAASALEAERRLYATLGSAIDTRFDTAFHRRFSKLVSRFAVARGLTPNTITIASLVVGLLSAWCFWNTTIAVAIVGLLVYAMAVILDHADGEVARLTLTESAIGEWLDIAGDTVTHVGVVLALGATSAHVTGRGFQLGVLAAAGFLLSAAVAKAWPGVAMPDRVGSALANLGSRDGFYAMLVAFIAALAVAPLALPWLMVVVAGGAHAYWVSRLLYRITRGA